MYKNTYKRIKMYIEKCVMISFLTSIIFVFLENADTRIFVTVHAEVHCARARARAHDNAHVSSSELCRPQPAHLIHGSRK